MKMLSLITLFALAGCAAKQGAPPIYFEVPLLRIRF